MQWEQRCWVSPIQISSPMLKSFKGGNIVFTMFDSSHWLWTELSSGTDSEQNANVPSLRTQEEEEEDSPGVTEFTLCLEIVYSDEDNENLVNHMRDFKLYEKMAGEDVRFHTVWNSCAVSNSRREVVCEKEKAFGDFMSQTDIKNSFCQNFELFCEK